MIVGNVNQPPPRPLGDTAPSQPFLPVQTPENVVAVHRRRNRAPRLPSNSQLLAARQQQAGSGNHAIGSATNIGDGQERQERATDLPVGPATERLDPWQLHFYDPPTRDVIERAKQFSHCDAASVDPFPIRALFNTKAVEYIDEAIAERRARGLIISEGKLFSTVLSVSTDRNFQVGGHIIHRTLRDSYVPLYPHNVIVHLRH